MVDRKNISVVLLDDHAVLRDGLESLIEGTDDLSVVGSLATVADLSACLHLVQVDVVVMGLVLDGVDGLRCIANMSAVHPDFRVLVLSPLPEDVCAERALTAGASGYLMKTSETADLLNGIRRVAAREVVVSPTIASLQLAQAAMQRLGSVQ
jgi:two-component system invasion response regulator UvrY